MFIRLLMVYWGFSVLRDNNVADILQYISGI